MHNKKLQCSGIVRNKTEIYLLVKESRKKKLSRYPPIFTKVLKVKHNGWEVAILLAVIRAQTLGSSQVIKVRLRGQDDDLVASLVDRYIWGLSGATQINWLNKYYHSFKPQENRWWPTKVNDSRWSRRVSRSRLRCIFMSVRRMRLRYIFFINKRK